ncbi:hypothetical protein VTI74DRAFT_3148 [Chaetomium olivicolor]
MRQFVSYYGPSSIPRGARRSTRDRSGMQRSSRRDIALIEDKVIDDCAEKSPNCYTFLSMVLVPGSVRVVKEVVIVTKQVYLRRSYRQSRIIGKVGAFTSPHRPLKNHGDIWY